MEHERSLTLIDSTKILLISKVGVTENSSLIPAVSKLLTALDGLNRIRPYVPADSVDVEFLPEEGLVRVEFSADEPRHGDYHSITLTSTKGFEDVRITSLECGEASGIETFIQRWIHDHC